MKDKRILILGIFILMALAIGITYAYFSAKIIGSETESTLVFDAGTLSINLDGGNTLNGDKMIPGDEPFSTKKFTVIGNNNSNGYMPYSVNLVIDENTYSTNAISYTLELVTAETDNNGEPIENRKNTPINYTDIIGSGYFTKGSNIKHTYILKTYFLDTHTDQSSDMRAIFNAHIEITGNRASKNKVTVTFDADGGELETTSKEAVIGSAYGELPIPTKEGYEFLGWNGKNLFKEYLIGQGINYGNGNAVNSSACSRSDFINVDFTNNNYYINELNIDFNSCVFYYNENKQYLGRTNGAYRSFILLDGSISATSATLGSIKYMRLSQCSDDSSKIKMVKKLHTQIEEGSEATEYEPYFIDKYTKVAQYENHTLKAIWKKIDN